MYIDTLPEKDYINLLEPIFSYLAVRDTLQPSDVIFVFGSMRLPQIWEHAAQLYFSNLASKILVAGGLAGFSRALNIESEADAIKKYLIEKGVPESAIVIEDTSTNTLENVTFGMKVLSESGIEVGSVILVAKPFHMRRCKATFGKQFPEIRLLCAPPQGSLLESIDRSRSEFAKRLIAEIERLQTYSQKGDITEQTIPDEVIAAIQKIGTML